MSAPTTTMVGGIPSRDVDVPILSVFLALFLTLGAANLTIFIRNRSLGRRFMPSWFMFVFCIIRVVTCSIRIAWATHQSVSGLATAAQVFAGAGTLILWLIDLVFARRIATALHPRVAGGRPVTILFWTLIALIPASFIMLVVILILNVTGYKDRNVIEGFQFYGQSIFLFVSFLPLVIAPLAVFTCPRRQQIKPFGSGSWELKLSILLFVSTLACITAGFRAGTTYRSFLGAGIAPWYTHKWAYYFFNFIMEFCGLLTYVVFRADKLFFIPGKGQEQEVDGEKRDLDSDQINVKD